MDLVPVGVIAIIVVGVVYYAYRVFPRYAYELTDDSLRVKRWVFRVVPFGTYVIPLRCIGEVRRLGRPYVAVGFPLMCGRLYSTGGVVLVLRKRRWGVFRRVYITPDNPDLFVGELRGKLRALGLG